MRQGATELCKRHAEQDVHAHAGSSRHRGTAPGRGSLVRRDLALHLRGVTPRRRRHRNVRRRVAPPCVWSPPARWRDPSSLTPWLGYAAQGQSVTPALYRRSRWRPSPSRSRYRLRKTAGQYAKQLGSTVEFEALNLGQFFGSPDGQLIRAGVALVFPGYLAGDIDLIVDALTLAAKAQARNKRIAVAPLIGLAAVGVGKLIYDANAA